MQSEEKNTGEDMALALPDFTIKDEMSNITLVVENTNLYLHKEVLAVWSPVFKAMFTHDFKDGKQKSIELPGKNLDDFIGFLGCIYPPMQKVTDDNVHGILALADEYQVKVVKNQCERTLLAQPESLEYIVLAQTYGLQALYKKCVQYAQTLDFRVVRESPAFKELKAETVVEILTERVERLTGQVSRLQSQVCTQQLENVSKSNVNSQLVNSIRHIACRITSPSVFCKTCHSRGVNQECSACLKAFRRSVIKTCRKAGKFLPNISQYK